MQIPTYPQEFPERYQHVIPKKISCCTAIFLPRSESFVKVILLQRVFGPSAGRAGRVADAGIANLRVNEPRYASMHCVRPSDHLRMGRADGAGQKGSVGRNGSYDPAGHVRFPSGFRVVTVLWEGNSGGFSDPKQPCSFGDGVVTTPSGCVAATVLRNPSIDLLRSSDRISSGRRQENAKTASEHLAPLLILAPINGKRGPPPMATGPRRQNATASCTCTFWVYFNDSRINKILWVIGSFLPWVGKKVTSCEFGDTAYQYDSNQGLPPSPVIACAHMNITPRRHQCFGSL